MILLPETIYHIYNRGNNKQILYFQERNYDFFLRKVVKELQPHLDFLSYCLMTNHFHLMVCTKHDIDTRKFSGSLRTLLSSYTRAIQKQEHITGSLFQQNSKSHEITDNHYAQTCFHYIHQNPLKAGLVKRIEDWPYHSFNEYWKGDKGICNTKLGKELLTIPNQPDRFYMESYQVLVVPPLKWWHDSTKIPTL